MREHLETIWHLVKKDEIGHVWAICHHHPFEDRATTNPVYIGATALKFRGGRSGAKRGEKPKLYPMTEAAVAALQSIVDQHNAVLLDARRPGERS